MAGGGVVRQGAQTFSGIEDVIWKPPEASVKVTFSSRLSVGPTHTGSCMVLFTARGAPCFLPISVIVFLLRKKSKHKVKSNIFQ